MNYEHYRIANEAFQAVNEAASQADTRPREKQVPGVPVGVRLVRVGPVKSKEFYLGPFGMKQAVSDATVGGFPVVVPDNVYDVIDLSIVPIPSGYERDGEKVEEWFREPKNAEDYINTYGYINTRAAAFVFSGDPRRIILRKIKPLTKEVLVIEYDNPTPVMKTDWLCNTGHRRCRLETRPL